MTDTHQFVERALRSALRILSKCSPEQQPSASLLMSIENLLDRHVKGTPASGTAERLARLEAKLNRLELGGMMKARNR